MIILIRTDLGMNKGKIGAMCAHAAIGAFQKASSVSLRMWNLNGDAKIVLAVNSLEELLNLEKRANNENLTTYKVRDAGLTQVQPGTVVALAIGPNLGSNIDKVTKDLKLL